MVSSGGAAQSARASLANRLAGAPLPLHWKKPSEDPVNLAQRWKSAASPAASVLDQEPLPGRKLKDAVAALAHESVLRDLLRGVGAPAIVVEHHETARAHAVEQYLECCDLRLRRVHVEMQERDPLRCRPGEAVGHDAAHDPDVGKSREPSDHGLVQAAFMVGG